MNEPFSILTSSESSKCGICCPSPSLAVFRIRTIEVINIVNQIKTYLYHSMNPRFNKSSPPFPCFTQLKINLFFNIHIQLFCISYFEKVLILLDGNGCTPSAASKVQLPKRRVILVNRFKVDGISAGTF